MTKSFYLRVISIAFLGISGASCASQDTKPNDQTTKQQMDQLRSEMTTLIGEAPCTTNEQCASIAIGAKPCGGPWSYRAYSTKFTDSEKLQAIAQNYKQLNKLYNKESGLMSDCMMVIEPGVACINSKCEISQP